MNATHEDGTQLRICAKEKNACPKKKTIQRKKNKTKKIKK